MAEQDFDLDFEPDEIIYDSEDEYIPEEEPKSITRPVLNCRNCMNVYGINYPVRHTKYEFDGWSRTECGYCGLITIEIYKDRKEAGFGGNSQNRNKKR